MRQRNPKSITGRAPTRKSLSNRCVAEIRLRATLLSGVGKHIITRYSCNEPQFRGLQFELYKRMASPLDSLPLSLAKDTDIYNSLHAIYRLDADYADPPHKSDKAAVAAAKLARRAAMIQLLSHMVRDPKGGSPIQWGDFDAATQSDRLCFLSNSSCPLLEGAEIDEDGQGRLTITKKPQLSAIMRRLTVRKSPRLNAPANTDSKSSAPAAAIETQPTLSNSGNNANSTAAGRPKRKASAKAATTTGTATPGSTAVEDDDDTEDRRPRKRPRKEDDTEKEFLPDSETETDVKAPAAGAESDRNDDTSSRTSKHKKARLKSTAKAKSKGKSNGRGARKSRGAAPANTADPAEGEPVVRGFAPDLVHCLLHVSAVSPDFTPILHCFTRLAYSCHCVLH